MLPLMVLIPAFINAAVLAGAVYAVARHDADYDWLKLVLIALGISVVNQILSGFVTAGLESVNLYYRYDWKGKAAYFVIWGPLALGSSAWIIHHYLRLMPRDAVVASAVYTIVSVALFTAFMTWWRHG